MRPLTLRRNYKWIAATLLVVCFFVSLLGNERIVPYISSFSWSMGDTWPTAKPLVIEQEADTLFSLEFMHEIEIEMDQDDYDAMILIYEETGEKEYFPINITIDGATYENAGIRLKGNSTLSSSLGTPMGPAGKTAKNHESDVPFLIKLNEFESGQNYQGYQQIALRSQFKDSSMMREVLGYQLLEAIDIPAPQSTYSVVTFNSEKSLYMMTEVIVEEFVEENLVKDGGEIGTLFKASVGAKLTYSSNDPLDYASFEQKTNVNEEDVYQIIELVEFITNSSDEEFIARLDEYIDVESTLRYLAFCNITVNLDSFASNGNNYYLYQDPDTDQFTIVPWDLNESFGGFWRYEGEAYSLNLDFSGDERQNNPGMMMPEENLTPEMMKYFKENGIQPPFTDEDIAAAAAVSPIAFNNPTATQEQQMLPNKRNRPIPPGFIPPNDNFEPPLGFDPDAEQPAHKVMGMSNPFVERLLSTDIFWKQYIEIVEELIDSTLSIQSIAHKVEELQQFVDNANETHNFWEDTVNHDYGTKELLDFICNRFISLNEQLVVVEN